MFIKKKSLPVLLDAKYNNIEVLPPGIRYSKADFTIEQYGGVFNIHYGLRGNEGIARGEEKMLS